MNRAAVTGTDEKQQPKNNGHTTIIKRGHIQATVCDQWRLLLFGLRGKGKHIITMRLLLLFKFIDYIIQKQIQIITDVNTEVVVQSFKYDCHFSPSLLTYFQSAASYCLTAIRPQNSNTNSMDSNWHKLLHINHI